MTTETNEAVESAADRFAGQLQHVAAELDRLANRSNVISSMAMLSCQHVDDGRQDGGVSPSAEAAAWLVAGAQDLAKDMAVDLEALAYVVRGLREKHAASNALESAHA